MPFYRINGMVVHVKLSGRAKPAGPCAAVVGFSAAAAERDYCCAPGAYLCDSPTPTGTCSAAMCERHVHQVGRNRHYCPDHAARHRALEPQLGLFTSLTGDQQ